MTNREMVKDPRSGGPKLPEPNLPQRVFVPAPEGAPNLFTTDDPIIPRNPTRSSIRAQNQGSWDTVRTHATTPDMT